MFPGKVTAQTSPGLVFEDANVIDGVSAEPSGDVTVVVRDGKIGSGGRNDPESAFVRSARNPFEDRNAVRDVLLVVNDGKIAVNALQF
jgi:hypothetical protein